jgi:hypothetical protein
MKYKEENWGHPKGALINCYTVFRLQYNFMKPGHGETNFFNNSDSGSESNQKSR